MTQPAEFSSQDYTAAGRLIEANTLALIRNGDINPRWLAGHQAFWYLQQNAEGSRHVLVDARTGDSRQAFDHEAVAKALNEALTPDPLASADKLGLDRAELSGDGHRLTGRHGDKMVTVNLVDFGVEVSEAEAVRPGLMLSPCGSHGVRREGDNLVLVEIPSGFEHRLTDDGEAYFSYGKMPDGSLQYIPLKKSGAVLPPFGAAFSPDGRYLICPRIDEREVGTEPFIEQVPTDGSMRPVVHTLRRAFVGDAAQTVMDWFVFDTVTGHRSQIELPIGCAPSMMLGNGIVGWSVERRQAFMFATTPASTRGLLLRIDLTSGATQTLIDEAAELSRHEPNTLMYNLPNVRTIRDGAELLWYSSRSGWGHLYRYDAQSGELLGQITSGDWMFFDIHHVDEERRSLYFTAGGREAGVDPYYRHLYRVGLDGSDLTLLTGDALHADHQFAPDAAPMFKTLFGVPDAPAKIRPEAGVFIDTSSTVDTPPVTCLRSLEDGALIAQIERADVSALLEAGYQPPSRQLLKADDGETDIAVVYYPPVNIAGNGAHPIIDACYGGPQVYVAPRNYVEAANTSNPSNRMALARLGFGVAVIDGRGTPGRGNAFRDAGFPHFSAVGLKDHIAAIRQLAQQRPELDIERVGIHGWSWGGTFSAQAILSRGDFYKVCVTGAGVYDYAALYPGFEQMIGMPVYADGSNRPANPTEKPQSWEAVDVTAMASSLTGKMLIVWGDADENVPPNQAYRLIEALIRAHKAHDTLVLPNKTHPTASQGLNPFTATRTWDYFLQHLMGVTPPVADAFSIIPRRVMQ